MSGIISSCKVKVNAAGDWQVVPPAGQIVQIGDAAATSRGLVNNDDLFVSGKFEVQLNFYANRDSNFYRDVGLVGGTGNLTFYNSTNTVVDKNQNNSILTHYKNSEQLTIPIGQGAAGVNTVGNLAPANSVIVAVSVRVTQAAGGGATTFSVGRTGGNIDEFIQALAIALGTVGTSAANSDGVNPGPVHNAAVNTFVVTTDANVTIADLKVRICVWSLIMTPPTS